MTHPAARVAPRATILVALMIASRTLGAQQSATDPRLPSGREVVERHVEAIGGRDALVKLASRHLWASYDIPGERVRGTIELFTARPNKRLLRVTPSGESAAVTGFDGEIGWRKDPGKPPVAIRGRELAQLRDDAAYDFDLHEPRDFAALQNLGVVTWEGRERYRLKVTSTSGREWTEFFDVATGLFAGSESRRETDKGQVTLKTVVAAYGTYDGVKLPSRLSLRSGGVEQIVKLMSVRHNNVKQSMFVAPSGLKIAARTETVRTVGAP